MKELHVKILFSCQERKLFLKLQYTTKVFLLKDINIDSTNQKQQGKKCDNSNICTFKES